VAKAQVDVCLAALQEAETNLGYTEIRSPVKGVIIDKRVNTGQTIITSLNAQSMFLVAKDLDLMEIWASVNEADVGQIHVGQGVRFTVASQPTREYRGKVTQIRFNATNTSNVVTYTVVVSFDNSKEKLMPYLTASLQFEVAQRKGVLYLPNSVLRWRPLLRFVEESERARWDRQLRRAPGGEADKGGMLLVNEAEARDRVVVWVDNGRGFVESREVQIGQTDGRVTEILSGLGEGDEVVWGVDHRKAKGPDNPFLPRFGNKGGQ
jgi:HlyD family secretion protein